MRPSFFTSATILILWLRTEVSSHAQFAPRPGIWLGWFHIFAKRPLSSCRLPCWEWLSTVERQAAGEPLAKANSTLCCGAHWLSLPRAFKSNPNEDELGARFIDLHLSELRRMAAVSPFGTPLPGCARKVLEDAYRGCDGKLAVWLPLTLFIWVSA